MSDKNSDARKKWEGGKPSGIRWESWIDALIREAQERGDFDNLRGHGNPLPDHQNPYLADEYHLAYDLIQDSGHTLPWIDDAKDIDRRTEAARQQLRRNYARYQAQCPTAGPEEQAALQAIWDKQRARFEQEVAEINRLIDIYNLKAPSTQLHKYRLIPAREYQRLGILPPDEDTAT